METIISSHDIKAVYRNVERRAMNNGLKFDNVDYSYFVHAYTKEATVSITVWTLDEDGSYKDAIVSANASVKYTVFHKGDKTKSFKGLDTSKCEITSFDIK